MVPPVLRRASRLSDSASAGSIPSNNPPTNNNGQNAKRKKAATMVLPPTDADIDPSLLTLPGGPNDPPPQVPAPPQAPAPVAKTVEEFYAMREVQLTAELRAKIEAEMRALYGINAPPGVPAPPYAIALPSTAIRATVAAAGMELQPEPPLAKISKPRGGLGEKGGYNMMEVLGLQKDEYRTILRSVRDLCHNARLDFSVPYKRQEQAILGKIYKISKNMHPIFRRCEHNWAVAALVRRYIRNRRKHLAKISNASLAGARYTIPDIDDIDLENDDEELE